MPNRETALESSKRLAIAMMGQAVRDLANRKTEYFGDAVRWIQTGDTGTFSFALCCQVLGWPQDGTRRLLLEVGYAGPSRHPGPLDQSGLGYRPIAVDGSATDRFLSRRARTPPPRAAGTLPAYVDAVRKGPPSRRYHLCLVGRNRGIRRTHSEYQNFRCRQDS